MNVRTTALVAALAFGAAAEEPREPKPSAKNPALAAMLKNTDYDKDGKLSLKEWRLKKVLFQETDTNGDGYLTAGEIERRSGPILLALASNEYMTSLKDRLDREDVVPFDADRDGRLSEKEYRAWLFAAADEDGDGALDLDESEAVAGFGTFSREFYGDGQRFIDRFDKDRDGRISATEFKPADVEFKSHDRDKDGRLTADEIDWREGNALTAFANQSVDTVMEKLDKNKNGKIEKGEAGGALAAVLERYDEDADGAANRAELDRALKLAQDVQLANMETDFIPRFDLSGDRKVSRKEFPGDDAIFARLDRNGDGFVTKADATP